MKKAIKFLLLVIALFVTVNVKALDDNVTVVIDKEAGAKVPVKKIDGNDDAYVFCINKDKPFYSENGDLYSDPIKFKGVSSIDGFPASKVNNIIVKAYLFGLGTGSNKYGLTESDFYTVTQIAVWHATDNYDYASATGFKSWVQDSNYRRLEAYNDLIAAENVNQDVVGISSVNSNSQTMKLTSDKKFYESDDFVIISSSDLEYTVHAKEDDSCVLYNGKCVSTATVKAGEKFKLRTANKSDSATASALISTDTYLSGYEWSLYVPSGNGTTILGSSVDENNQNTVAYVPYYSAYYETISAKSVNETKDLKVSKTDATGQNEIGGATMFIYDLDGGEFTHWTSEEGKTHYVKGLEVDKIYRLEETVAPEGYDKLTTDIYFKVNEDGSVTTCKTDVAKANGTCEAMSSDEILNIKNYPTKTTGKVKVSKRDFTNGEEIPGAHLQIIDENGQVVADWTSTDKPYEIELKVGKYTLVETIPATDYEPDMIIEGNTTSRYEFEITKDGMTKIDVYNKLKAKKIIDVPITGMNATGLYIIGGLVTLAGTRVIVYAKKKENM